MAALSMTVTRLNKHFPHWSETPARIPNQPFFPAQRALSTRNGSGERLLFEPTRSIVDKRSCAISSGRPFAPVSIFGKCNG